MRSMTGYGRFTLDEFDRQMTIELKSVNHRYLDLSFRIPRVMQFCELSLRKSLGAALSRGHVDVSLTYQNFAADARQASVDKQLALSYLAAARDLKQRTGVDGEFTLSELMNLPEVMKISEGEEDEATLMGLCQRTLTGAISALLSSREQEGNDLGDDLAAYLKQMKSALASLLVLAPVQPDIYRQRLTQRLEQLAPEGLDPWRLTQEVALFADRAAIDEELSRLSAHITRMHQLLQTSEPIGRQIDFLSQEMNREINTIGSKSSSLPITNLVLELKNTLEKVREQIQNVE